MEEHFLTYEQSLAVKELGFDEPCMGGFVKLTDTQNTFFMNEQISDIDRETPLHPDLIVNCPLKSQFFKWVRYKGYKPNIVNDVSASKDGFYYFDLWLSGQILWETDYIFETYEQAEDACINKIIELLKTK